MQSVIGNSIKLSLFGESHGNMIGVVIDGLAPGIKLDTKFIQEQLDKSCLLYTSPSPRD